MATQIECYIEKEMWDFTKTRIQPNYFPTMVLGNQYIGQTMRKAKNLALSII